VSQYKYNTLRISLTNDTNPKTIYMILNKRIIIKNLKSGKENTKLKSIVKTVDNTDVLLPNKTIVIDPGHGGKDVGAVGPKKRYEKKPVLKVAKYLYDILKKRGYKVYLTRSNDKYLKLKSRTKYANRRNADLFLSIHANSVPKSKANKLMGVETYFLSPARSDRAKRVAAIENKGDMDSMSMGSKNTFLTVLNRSKITEANKLAIDIQKNMLYTLRKKYSKIRDGGVREGPFWILVGAQMPAVLVEIGYISNPLESLRLYNSSYQKLLATGIADGIDSYFFKNQ
jgi:N-acetylmuramoyl-L-alanine amidase